MVGAPPALVDDLLQKQALGSTISPPFKSCANALIARSMSAAVPHIEDALTLGEAAQRDGSVYGEVAAPVFGCRAML